MKTFHSIALALVLPLALPLLAPAKTLEQLYIESCRQGPAIPYPIAVVTPEVTPCAAGKSVTAQFVVDRTGRPSDITISAGANDPTLRAAVVAAVKQWRFRPARRNGAEVPATVEVPFVFAPGEGPKPFVLDFVREDRRKS